MLLERFYDEDLAHASYLIGCQASGEGVVVDPRRDVDDYLQAAAKNGLTVTAVAETHIHADYLSGTRELASRTGATMYVSDEGGPDWSYGSGFEDAVKLADGDTITLGSITVTASHTPGHTPEHLTLLVTDGARADRPGYALTGDFVFVGEVGRPDLLDEAAGGEDTRFAGAKQLFASLRDRFLTLPGDVQVLPAHGSGSACGKALGAVPTTTVGYERSFSWWAPYVLSADEQGFVDELLAGQPDAHAYFARMKVQNREGPALLGEVREPAHYSADELREALTLDRVIVLDTRSADEIHAGTVPGSLNVPGLDKAASFGAWAYDPETEHRPLVVLAADADRAREFRDHLVRVGIDAVAGYVTSFEGLDLARPDLVEPKDLPQTDYAMLVDVRAKSEYAAGHIPGAVQLSGGRALWQTQELPDEGTIVTYCQSGTRNSVVAAALRRRGYDVAELDGSYAAWQQTA